MADRDHCLQYMVAIGLIYGKLEAQDYSDLTAADERIDSLYTQQQVSKLMTLLYEQEEVANLSVREFLSYW